MMKKTLYRINEGKILAGVCTGLSDYLNLDVNVIRLLTIIASLVSGIGIVAYIAAAILLPEAQ